MEQLSREEQKQYSRHLLLEEIGLNGQVKLKQAKVLMVGAGGLGTPVLQYLTAAGVGTIGIVDNDTVEQSNLQRQILFTVDDLGQKKAKCAAQRLSRLNPYIDFKVFSERLTNLNAIELFQEFDIIVDGTDNFETRYLINDAAVLTNKPIVFGSIFKFDGQVSVFNYQNGPTYRCLYPTSPSSGEMPNCSEVGVLGVLSGIIGSFQANEVLKIILNIGTTLSGKLLTFDALTMKQFIFSVEKNECLNITELPNNVTSVCKTDFPIEEITYDEYLMKRKDFHVLDVRTKEERAYFSIDSMHIPLSELEKHLEEIPKEKLLLVVCKSGVRSKKAIELIQKNTILEHAIYNLTGGLQAILYNEE